jgi:hypothetical protein
MNPATDWIEQARRVLDALRAPSVAAPGEEGDAHAADCRWCPICQVGSVVRGERPEVTAALADVLTATATALRTFAADTDPARADAPAPEPEGGASAPPVQQIDIA